MNKLKTILLTMSLFIVSCVTCFADSVSPSDYKYYVVINDGNATIYFNEYEKLNDGLRVKYPSSLMITSSGYNKGVSNYTTNNNVVSTNNISLSQFLGVTFDGDVLPPVIAPTVEGAIQKIVPDFSTQLLEFLPIGITILVILLGVQLIPRLVAWFL